MKTSMNAATAQDTSDAAPAMRAASGPATNHTAPIIEPREKAVRANGPTRLLSLRLVPISMGIVVVGMVATPLPASVEMAVDMASPNRPVSGQQVTQGA
jgi:hypothetical protein